ncbi:hypothetical protein GCM10010343_31810 [Streptomyces avidinii]|nr:hypothetical protein GCM10010343_31810 [Streptomyces avidinii]
MISAGTPANRSRTRSTSGRTLPRPPAAGTPLPEITFRRQNFGDYEIPSLHRKEGLEPAGRTGFGPHLRG